MERNRDWKDEQQNERNDEFQNGEKQNTSSENKERKGSSAANIDSIISSPTDNVRSRRSSSTLSNTGTNTSYEGNSNTLGGGSVGTGQTSGQSGVGARISTTSDYDQARVSQPNKKEDDQNDTPERDPYKRDQQERDII